MTTDVLVVDDDPIVGSLLVEIVRAEGRTAVHAATRAEGRARFIETRPRLAFLDVNLPDGSGLDLLEEIRALDPLVATIVMTSVVETETIVAALQRGAASFLEKPFTAEQIRGKVRELGDRVATEAKGLGIIGRSRSIIEAIERIRLVAAAPSTTALVLGESGTGKELAARAIHAASARAAGPFVPVNCAALGDLIESELFGYEKHAFTGAAPEGKKGIFEAAGGGTVFLDEIGETTPAFQAALLRVLQEKRVKRVGGIAEHPVDVRVVASTNRDLAKEVSEGRFRRDLFFRLHVVPIVMPPLRVRGGEDVALLARHFAASLAGDFGRAAPALSEAALAALAARPWPGNVRELRNVIERAIVLSGGGPRIEVAHVSEDASPAPSSGDFEVRLPDLRLESAERVLLQRALEVAKGNRTRAAELLGINRATLYNKAKALGISLEES